jgi:long-chain acyl-CoA synthetase
MTDKPGRSLPYSYTDTEYRNIKQRERDVIAAMLKELKNTKNRYFLYRDKHVVTDLKDMLNYSAEHFPDRPFLKEKPDAKRPYRDTTFRETLSDVNALGTALCALGLKDTNIGVIGRNSVAWCETYLAVTCGTGVIVPLDKELNENELAQLTVKGELEAVVTIDEKYYETFKRIKAVGGNDLRYVITASRDTDENAAEGLLSWTELRQTGRKMVWNGDRSFENARVLNTDVATILFTSGTTGVAKGVMLSHRSLLLDAILAQVLFSAEPEDACFSVLPLNHAYECTATFLTCAYTGASIAFSRSLKSMRTDILEAKPTIMLAVPAIIENFYAKIMKGLRDQLNNKLLRKIADKAIESNIRIRLPRKARENIRELFGGKLRAIISGGAAIDASILNFFNDVGINAIQGYGLSECAPIVALNPDKPKLMKNASAGHLLPFVECHIEDKNANGIGEICFRGPIVMSGYYRDPERTAEVIDEDGWFHTGDLGYLDADNFVFITGRKKNVIVTSNGKNVYPEELEAYLLESRYIAECMVWAGDTDPGSPWNGISVTVRPDEQAVREKLGEGYTEEAEAALIEAEVDRFNANQPRFKNIVHTVIRHREFDKTTSLKIRRFIDDNKRP